MKIRNYLSATFKSFLMLCLGLFTIVPGISLVMFVSIYAYFENNYSMLLGLIPGIVLIVIGLKAIEKWIAGKMMLLREE